MLSFDNDYNTGAHPQILARFLETNLVPQTGYGNDEYCTSAKEKIRAAIGKPEADIFFLVGGTQTNAVVISSLLMPYQGVIAADTGHVSVHEAGAIEHTGHKVLVIPSSSNAAADATANPAGTAGKIAPAALRAYLEAYYADGNYEHMVFPGAVYISHPTELGTLYTKAELTALHEICREYKIPLFLDGARLGYGLMSKVTDVTLADIAELTDVFYIGGTKVGAICGEAVVFPNGNMPAHFLTHVKQNGALLAKGRLLGIQFDTLFTDDLYLAISKNAIDRAAELVEVMAKHGFATHSDSPTNQQFFAVSNDMMVRLAERVAFSFWENLDADHTVIRFVTSWATTKENIEELDQILAEITG